MGDRYLRLPAKTRLEKENPRECAEQMYSDIQNRKLDPV